MSDFVNHYRLVVSGYTDGDEPDVVQMTFRKPEDLDDLAKKLLAHAEWMRRNPGGRVHTFVTGVVRGAVEPQPGKGK